MIRSLLLLATWALSSQAATFTVWVGYEDLKTGLSVNQYIPSDLSINQGDTVIFKQKTHEMHTVTFHPDTPGQVPDLFTPALEVNLTVATTTVFPAPGTYNGKYFASSGMMAVGTPVTEWSVTFSDIGEFPYDCSIHTVGQSGKITVVPAGTKVPPPRKVRENILKWKAKVDKKAVQVRARGARSVKKTVHNSDGTKTVYFRMGYSEPPFYDFLSFFPREHKVKPGDKVEWYGGVFHTVTFLNGAPLPDPVAIVGGKPAINPQWYIPAGGLVINRDNFINLGLFTQPDISVTATVGDIAKGKLEFLCMPHAKSGMIGHLRVK